MERARTVDRCQPPPVITPPNATEAGGRASTEGRVWVEDLENETGATLMDYVMCMLIVPPSESLLNVPFEQSGAVTDLSLWPSNPTHADFFDLSERYRSY